MGMFDHINYECICPVCHRRVDHFQSKSDKCQLSYLKPTDVENFYSPCLTCGCWLDFTGQSDGMYLRKVTGKDDEEIEAHRKYVKITN